MATYEITAPDGGTYQVDAPDEASQDEVLKTFHDHLTAQKVAADRSRLNVDTGRLAVNPLAAYDMVRNAVRGQWFGSYADEAAAKAGDIANKATGGKIGQPYDEGIAYQREMNRQSDEDNPYLGPTERIGFGLTGGAPLAKTIMKGGGTLTKAVRGGGLGGAYGFLYGSGEAEPEKGESRIEKGFDTITEPSLLNPILLGTALPPAVEGAAKFGGKVRDLAAPWLARARANLENFPEYVGLPKMSAGTDDIAPGAQAHAEQMLADYANREGISIDDVERQFANAERSVLYNGGGPRGTPGASYGENALSPLEAVPAWQKLGGTAVRASPEAAKHGAVFQSVRQTGVTPQEGFIGDDQLAGMGLPHREPLAPINRTDRPMGQQERIDDNLRRALLIRDEDYHGHAATAYKTEQQTVADAQAKAKPAYTALYKRGAMTDLTPVLEKVHDQWAPDGPKLANESQPVIDKVQQIAKLFRSRAVEDEGNEGLGGGGKGPIYNIQKFDNTKRHVDDLVGNMSIDTAAGRHMQAVVSEFKNDLIAAVDKVKKNGIGARYQAARQQFSDAMKMRDMLRAGAAAADQDDEAAIDVFRTAKSKAEQKMFRLGYYGKAVDKINAGKLSNDATQFFQRKNTQNILREIIPAERTPTGRVKIIGGAPAVYSDRPQRFGRAILNEQRITETGRKVFGNSATAERLADDEAAHALFDVADRIKEGAKAATGGGDLWARFYDWTIGRLVKHFGMRQDTAAALARDLFTTDKARIQRTLASVRMRMGNNRYERFRQMLADHHAEIVRTSATTAAQGQNEE